MASLVKRSGKFSLRFVDHRQNRRTVALGTTCRRTATYMQQRIENMVAEKRIGVPLDLETKKWLKGLKGILRERLAKYELCDATVGSRIEDTLAGMLKAYFARRNDVKPATRINWGHTERNLIAFFSAEKSIRSITAGDARDFERYLRTEARENAYAESDKAESLGAATIRKRISNAKLFFGDALERGLIESNPFAKLKGASVSNTSRQFFVTLEMTERLLDACPDSQWRLIIALARYGGLRCPSELVGLELADADWERCRLRVRSPKTEHHEGKGERIIPIFPELKPHLETVWHEAPEGEKYFITRYRDASQNLRTTFQKIIVRAGLTPWPKLFQNLRSSRQTELEESYPSHVVCAWMGNSQAVAQRHYLQTTDEHFSRAASASSEPAARTTRASKALEEGVPAGSEGEKPRKKSYLPVVDCESMGDVGLEPTTSTL